MMLKALLIAMLAAQVAGTSPPPVLHSLPPGAVVVPPVACPPSESEIERALALPLPEFDQGLATGWRLYGLNRCYDDAAKLIAAYIARHPGTPALLLRWHQAQMVAYAGDTPGALALVQEVNKLGAEGGADHGWQLYVAGTEAFLARRRDDLAARIAELSTFSAQEGPQAMAAKLNLNVLDGLLRCFDRPYKEAYEPPCLDLQRTQQLNREMGQAAPAVTK